MTLAPRCAMGNRPQAKGSGMQRAMRVLFFGLGLLTLANGKAFAGDVVVPPLLARGAPSQVAANMTTLVASELEFTGEFETVNQLSKRPGQLGTNCLGSSGCLAGIAGGKSLVAGKVTKYGKEYEVSLTYLTNRKIVRMVKRRMATDPSVVADEISVLVRHAVTGVDPAAKAEADRVSGFEGGGIALMDDEDDGEDDDDLLMAAPPVPASSDLMGGSDPDLFEEDPEDDGGIVGGFVPVPTPGLGGAAAGSMPGNDFSADDISFGGSAEDISFGSATSIIEVEEEDVIEEDPIDQRPRYSDELDEPTRAPARVRTPRERNRREPRSRSSQRARGPRSSSGSSIDMTGRIGYARFQYMNFVTYGVEAGIQLSDSFAVIGGLEAYSTRRNIPPELVPTGMPAVQWNTLVPIHANAVYRPREGDLKPFFGAGLQLIPAYVKEAQTVAFGARAIGGMDQQLTDNFGINLTATAGFWAGTEWYRIQGLMNTGFTAQISAGSVLSF